jgi:transcriptional regulator with XRE-family HTH domain
MDLTKLRPREQMVMILRWGLKDGKKRTLEEVAEELGTTRERVRQIEQKAVTTLRGPTLKQLCDLVKPLMVLHSFDKTDEYWQVSIANRTGPKAFEPITEMHRHKGLIDAVRLAVAEFIMLMNGKPVPKPISFKEALATIDEHMKKVGMETSGHED